MKPYQALIWNEWRQMRGNVIALAGVTVLLWLMLLAASFNKAFVEYIEMIATALAIGLPLLYSIVLADSFAREFSQKTNSFLLELPVTPTKIFFCKYLANLGAFLVLVILEAQLMSRLICLTPGKHYTDGIKSEDWLIELAAIIAIWILAHTMVFLASLIGRRTGNGIAAIIIMPLLCLLLVPAAGATTMFFVNDNNLWARLNMLFALFFLYCGCIGTGWYLWTFRLSRGKKILKPLITVLAIMLVAPWILHGIAYCFAVMSFNASIREARAAGLTTNIKELTPTPVPDEQNTAVGMSKFYNEYRAIASLYSEKNKKSGQKAPGPLPSYCDYSGPLWTGTDFHNGKKNRETLPPKTTIEVTEFIMNDPRMNQCCNTLAEALKKPYCQFEADDANKYCSPVYFHANTAVHFLIDRAYALRMSGRNNDFFACLADIDKIADAFIAKPLANLKSYGLTFKIMKYQAAISAGPDTSDAAKFYNQMIREIDLINPVLPDETFRIYDYLENSDKIVKPDKLDSFLQQCKFHLPRLYQSAAAWVRWKIQYDKLLKHAAASTNLQIMMPEIKSMRMSMNEIPGIFIRKTEATIWQYFSFRGQFESRKLCLALKIYHIKYGKFPDSLQQLVPEILPKIPVCPDTGKDYIYQPETNGFHLLTGCRSFNNIKYQTWDIKPEQAK